MPGTACRLCGSGAPYRVFRAREMMLGLRDSFDYLECSRCGCIQLMEHPNDWTRYYPSDYYSFESFTEGFVKRMLKRVRARHALGQRSPWGAALTGIWGIPPFARWIRPVGLDWADSVLDVGCGAGQVLFDMSNAGFLNLTGIDPYMPASRTVREGFVLQRAYLHELRGPFDFVMMNHSFEHMEDPEAALTEAARLLRPGRCLMIRTPVAGKWAWREYGVNWVQLDPPRHVFIPSEKGLLRLAERSGFSVKQVIYDSDSFQFWGSEQYAREIPLRDTRSYAVNPGVSMFTPAQIEDYGRRASALNEQADGDQASFYLVREG